MNLSKQLCSLLLICILPFCCNAASTVLIADKPSSLFSISTEHKPEPVFANAQNGVKQFTFTNSENQTVNGVFLTPFKPQPTIKFALALHPMGDSHSFWWRDKKNLGVNKLSDQLRHSGFTVIALDARLHGERAIENFGPRELLKNAHSDDPSLYNETISGSVRDYRELLNWLQHQYKPERIVALGYSMGAQMSLLLARFEPSISNVLTMVPPFVSSKKSPVAPRKHTPHIASSTSVTWLAATKDQFSDSKGIQDTFDLLTSPAKEIIWFDSGHRLPPEFIDHGLRFISTFGEQ